MRIGLTEFVLILCIAVLTVGPSAALWVSRWLRRAQKSYGAASRRRAEEQARRAAEREEILQRFQKLSIAFVAAAAAALLYGLVLRPIDAPPQTYTAPPVRQAAAAVVACGESLSVGGYESISCVRQREGWVYFSAQSGKNESVLARMHADGSGLAAILTVEGEITGFDFDPSGELWFTVVTSGGGALYRAGYDGWGAAMEQVVSQIDGRALSCPAAAAVGADGKVYFTDAASAPAKDGAEAALRTELLSHTATGQVYVYDPAARTVQRVLGGVAGAAGLALSPDGQTLYVSDLGSRCIWAVDANARELTAGGKGCGLFADGLSGYPAALAADEDGTVYVAYRWARSAWLEEHAGGTLLRGAALRLSRQMQEGLFRLPADCPAAEALGAGGQPLQAFSGRELGSAAAICPAGSRLYLGIAGQTELRYARI